MWTILLDGVLGGSLLAVQSRMAARIDIKQISQTRFWTIRGLDFDLAVHKEVRRQQAHSGCASAEFLTPMKGEQRPRGMI